MTDSKPAKPEEAPAVKKSFFKRALKWCLILLVLLILTPFVINFTLWMMESPNFEGEMAELLPDNTSAFIVLKEFGSLAEDFSTRRVYKEIVDNEDVMQLLIDPEDLEKIQKGAEKIPPKLRREIFFKFVNAHFGKQAAAALVQFHSEDKPAFYVFSRIEINFVHRVAELCSTLYPELHLTKEKYKGIDLFQYSAEKSKRSFTFFRMGETLVMSLRSDDTQHLKNLIDFREQDDGVVLSKHPAFIETMKRVRQERGLLAYLNNDNFLQDFKAFNREQYDEKMAKPTYFMMQQYLKDFGYGHLSLTFDDRLELRLELSDPKKEPGETSKIAAPAFANFDLVPTNSLLVLAGASDTIRPTISKLVFLIGDFYGQSRQKKIDRYKKKYKDDPKRLKKRLDKIERQKRQMAGAINSLGGEELFENIGKVLGEEYLVVLESFKPTLFTPIPFAQVSSVAMFENSIDLKARLEEYNLIDSVAEIESSSDEFAQYRMANYNGFPLLQTLYLTGKENRLFVTTEQPDPNRMLTFSNFPNQNMTGNTTFQRAYRAAPKDGLMILYLNLEAFVSNVERLQKMQMFGGDKLEEWLQEDKATFDLLKILKGLLLEVANPEGRNTVSIIIPVN